jgi:hypothetical protein
MGLDGERLVTKKLRSALSGQFYLINDIKPPGTYTNIDHVLLSPKGIFVIETKNYNGKITCQEDLWSRKSGGKIGSPSLQAKYNAFRIYEIIKSIEKFKLFKLWIEPIVVFSNLDAELTLKKKTVAVERLNTFIPYILNYDGENQFSPQDLNLIGNEILDKTL